MYLTYWKIKAYRVATVLKTETLRSQMGSSPISSSSLYSLMAKLLAFNQDTRVRFLVEAQTGL